MQGRIDAEGIKRHAWLASQPRLPAARLMLPAQTQSVKEIRDIIERARKRRAVLLQQTYASATSVLGSQHVHDSLKGHYGAAAG